MNKIISKMAEQAGLVPTYEAQEQDIEQFAKNLLTECVNICLEQSPSVSKYQVAEAIIQRFGLMESDKFHTQ